MSVQLVIFAPVLIDLPISLIQKYSKIDAGTIVVTVKEPGGGQTGIQPRGKKPPCRFKEDCPTIAGNYDDDVEVNFTNTFIPKKQEHFLIVFTCFLYCDMLELLNAEKLV